MLRNLMGPRTLRRCAPAAAALTVLAATPAMAGNVWQIQTANSPTTGAPITGGGSWIVNKQSGYYLGRSLPGWEFDNEQTTPANWHYGRAITGLNMCGWAMPGSMATLVRSVTDSCSDATKDTLSHRLTVGRDFNAPAHATGDGTASPADTGCTLYYNYFHGTDFTSNGGHWADAAGTASATVMYRFTTRDGRAAVVRDPSRGWGFLPIGCVTRPSALYNDND
ncbi:hypothetical protein AB0N87_38580 [Streptomyces sp. NPDC093228]|uniref:hypothetical protein n=1 Tax=unclassified Streptomyces TaxID=2593676 RepID=UPI0007411EAA|nr:MULTISPECIES: hypothetical protein [unclassified Streptomyces]KUJ35926.1 hypothetical protein ADL25_34800 [Streptomyces sp. NRRL F-5122]MDX3265702.1 hypothetical protein [Streptomyces sp. MI02-2A]